MEEQDHPTTIDRPESISPPDNPVAVELPDQLRSVSQSSCEPGKKTPALSQRLAEAFREGLASAKSGTQKPEEIRMAVPKPKDRKLSDQPGILDRVIREGEAAASVLYDKAAGVLDSAVQLAKKAPDLSTKWVEAFRQGATSVRPGEVKAKENQAPQVAGRLAVDRGILDRLAQAGDSAAEVVRGALASVKPGEVRGAEKKIRRSEKMIGDLYVEIGREAADSWSAGGPVETEKVRALLDELRKQEEGIQDLRANMSEIVAARKAEALKKRPVAQEVGGPIPKEDFVPSPAATEIEAAPGEVDLPVVMEAPPEDQAEVRETEAWSPDLVEGEQTGEETTLPRELAPPPPEPETMVPSLTEGDQTAEEATPEEEHPAPLAAGAAELPEDQTVAEVKPIVSAPSD